AAGAAAELQKLTTNLNDLRLQFAREPDPVKKANELTEKVNAAQKELDEKQPELLRAVVAKNPDTPFGIDAAVDLLRGAARFKLTPDEATKAPALVEKGVAPVGTRYAQMTTLSAVETLANTKGLEATAVAAAEKLQKAITPSDPAAYESRVLSAYKAALERSDVPNKDAALKTVAAALEKIEGKLDAEYMAKVPPFKPTAFAGRKDKTANQVVMMELFTGAQCPP